MVRALVPLVDGFEEIEATTTIDVLRRAGFTVVTAGIPNTMVRGARDIQLTTDEKMDTVNLGDFDMLVLVGGDPGYKNLQRSQAVLKAIHHFDDNKKLIAAICAAPAVLAQAGVLENVRATIHPGMERDLPKPRNGRVVEDQHFITSQGPGTAMEFALKIVEKFSGRDAAGKLKTKLCC